MHHTQRSLKTALNKSIVFWSIALFISLFAYVAFAVQALTNQSIQSMPLAIAIWTGFGMLLLLIVSAKALHFMLNRQLLQPSNQLLQTLDDHELDDKTIHQLKLALPQNQRDETSDSLADYETLKHSHHDLQVQLSSILQTL